MLKAIEVNRNDIVKVMLIKNVEVDLESLRRAITEGNEWVNDILENMEQDWKLPHSHKLNTYAICVVAFALDDHWFVHIVIKGKQETAFV